MVLAAGGGTTTFKLALPPTGKPPIGTNGLPINPSLLLGENETAFVSYGSHIVSFNLASSSAMFNTMKDTIHLREVIVPCGVVLQAGV
jgi:hypothetical protein